MKKIFLSRATVLPNEYIDSFNHFESFLKEHECEIKTLGVTMFTSSTPLKAINSEIQKCDGCIIFGTPQMIVNQTILKPNTTNQKKIENTSISFSTPWNQIEAALAYAHEKPLMIISDELIHQEGFFENSTSKNFIQRYNLKSSKWYNSQAFIEITQDWLKKI